MVDEIVTPENTKLIAEWMDKEFTTEHGGIHLKTFSLNAYKTYDLTEYNLITNATQSREVEEKLIYELKYSIHAGFDSSDTRIEDREGGTIANAPTLPLAIYKAALMEAKK